jgi:hypothetical protein
MTFFKRKHLINRKGKLSLYLWISFVFCGFVLCSRGSLYAQETELNYHGFKVNFSEVKDSAPDDTVVRAVKRQIEIVEHVKLGEDDLNFFKSIPITMIPDASGTPGVYSAVKNTVFLKVRELAPNRPILLHEFLHAYHYSKITDGFRNEQVRGFYEEAKNNYPNFRNEYFLSNAKEFFAVTASIYLFGDIPRPPFNRAAIKKTQPEFYQYLENLIGPGKSK